MTSHSETYVSPPTWVASAKQHHPGGAAIMAFGLVLWALFLGTVAVPVERAPDGGEIVAAAR